MKPLALQAAVHDLKNALGTLEGELERLVVQEHIAAVAPAHLQCSQLRTRLLGFLLLSTKDGRLQAHIEAHPPEDFLREVAAGFVVPAGGPSLEVSVSTDCPAVGFFDSRLLNLALHSLLANALRFAHCRMVIGARKSDSGLLFYCEDDGPGWGAGPNPAGSGLGTSICESVVQAHVNRGHCGHLVMGTSSLGGARVELHLP
jgi:signal transduction histidine kinase